MRQDLAPGERRHEFEEFRGQIFPRLSKNRVVAVERRGAATSDWRWWPKRMRRNRIDSRIIGHPFNYLDFRAWHPWS